MRRACGAGWLTGGAPPGTESSLKISNPPPLGGVRAEAGKRIRIVVCDRLQVPSSRCRHEGRGSADPTSREPAERRTLRRPGQTASGAPAAARTSAAAPALSQPCPACGRGKRMRGRNAEPQRTEPGAWFAAGRGNRVGWGCGTHVTLKDRSRSLLLCRFPCPESIER